MTEQNDPELDPLVMQQRTLPRRRPRPEWHGWLIDIAVMLGWGVAFALAIYWSWVWMRG